MADTVTGTVAPIVSFIARQRDISEMVGEQYTGPDLQILRDTLDFFKGRFNVVSLEDRNLPTVVQKRVVQPKDDAAKAKLEKAFNDMRVGLGQSWSTLLGEQGDERAFRQVYPFSPALIEALVALSNFLQRERTALKVLVEMLVEHMDDFELGRVVPVGDLFDVLAGGEEPMDGAMRERFVSARHLYQNELLPRIQAENETGNKEKCQRLRDNHRIYLGCSNCREGRCRADNRLVKTAILGALVPGVPVLRNLTVSRLVQLNHGTLRSPIPGQEATIAAGRLRSWSAEIGKLRVEGEGDPEVKIVLEGVDVRPIIGGASGLYTAGAGRKMMRGILYEALDVAVTDELVVPHKVTWRGSHRHGVIQFGNVREMDDTALSVPPDKDFKLVIDYPFDEPGRRPEEDEKRLDDFRQSNKSTTVVWLPDFFGEKVNRDLRELVVIDHVLNTPLSPHLVNLRPEEQRRAIEELEHLRAQKRARVRRALEAAYGLKKPEEGEIDQAYQVEHHIHVLWPGWDIRGVTESVLGKAVAKAVEEVLKLRFPRHPHFTSTTPGKLKGSLDKLEQLCETDNGRLPISKQERVDWEILESLGIVAATEAAVTLRQEWVIDIEKALLRENIEQTPTVDQLKKLLDPQGQRGLLPEVSDLEVLAYSLVSKRELLRGGLAVKEPTIGKLIGDMELVKTPLPEEKAWQDALIVAGKLFGAAVGGRARTARHLRLFFDKVVKARDEAFKAEADHIGEKLARWSAFFPPACPRTKTAERVSSLLIGLQSTDAVELVQCLGTFDSAPSSLEAIKKQLQNAAKTVGVLRDDVYLNVFEALQASGMEASQQILSKLAAVLSADELSEDLAKKLPLLVVEAQQLLHKPKQPVSTILIASGEGRGLANMDTACKTASLAIEKGGPQSEVEFSWRVVKTK